jgi:hypothetical protein
MISAACLAALALLASDRSSGAADPLAAEIERGLAIVRDRRDSSETWQQVRQGSGAMFERAAQALRERRRLVALNRLGAARANVTAYLFTRRQPAAALTDTTGLAAAWVREGDSLRALPPASAARAKELHPAAIRALAEAAIPQVRNYYDASLVYGYNDQPEFGYFYMGVARANREFFDLCVALSGAASSPEPAIRSIAAEVDSLEARVLAAYRPPLSIDRHAEFIGVSSTLKEARELEAAGLHHGALFRYLFSALRFAPLRPRNAPVDSAAALGTLDAFEARLAAGKIDHSIGQLFIETARVEMSAAPAGRPAPIAVGIALDVMPLYFAAVEPAPRATARATARAAAASAAAAAKPAVTVTLVRWPYT